MRIVAALLALAILAACGADGAPLRPGATAVTLGGQATIGVRL